MIVKTSADGDSYIANPDAHGVLVFNELGNGVWTPCTRQKLYDRDAPTVRERTSLSGLYNRLFRISGYIIIAAEEPLQQSLVNSLFLFALQLGGKNLSGV